MFEEKFSQGNSSLHLADSRIKIIAALLFAVCTAWVHSIPSAVLAFFVSFCLLMFSKLPLRPVLKRLFWVNGLICFLWLFLPFSMPGVSIFCFAGFCASKNGILLAALITIKSNSILLAIICLLSTSNIPELGNALHRLKVPAKFILLFLITYRYLHVIEEEYSRLYKATLARGFTPSTNIHTYRTYANLVGMLLIKSFERAERIYQAMLLRGFNGRFYSLQDYSICIKDVLLLSVILFSSFLIKFFDFYLLQKVFY